MSPIDFQSDARFPGSTEVLAGHDLSGKLAVVTGGSGGIGLAYHRVRSRGAVRLATKRCPS